MNEVLLTTLVDKSEAHDKEISEIKETVKELPDRFADIGQLEQDINKLKNDVDAIRFPKKEVQELSKRLNETLAILKQPVANETIHHHHIPKIIFTTVILFIAICCVTTGWYMTSNKLDLYKANDSKYRYLKLYDNQQLQLFLIKVDSIYLADTNFRDSIITQENIRLEQFQVLQQVHAREEEIKVLKDKIKYKGR